MSDKPQEEFREEETRREILKQVGKAAVIAPAVTLLLSANTVPANASVPYGTTDS